MLWLVPGLLVACSAKDQSRLRLGIGMPAVYIQYLGVTLLMSSGLAWMATWTWIPRKVWGGVLVGASAVIAMITYDCNRITVNKLDGPVELCDWRVLRRALRSGLADNVPTGTTIRCNEPYPWLLDGPRVGSAFLVQNLGASCIWPMRIPACVRWELSWPAWPSRRSLS